MKNSVFNNDMWMETADVSVSLPPLELHRGKDGLAEYASKNPISDDTKAKLYSTMLTAPRWLPHASKVYETSSDVTDYFTVPTIIMPTDLPNRNLTAFPREELARFDPEIGDHVYAGWKGKPVYIEHDNMDYKKAIGAVVDVSMRPITGTNLHKVIALMAIDRTKNPEIANAILAGRRRTYSMGAMVRAYECSVCKAMGFIKPGIKNKYEVMPCGKEHAYYDRQGRFRVVPTAMGARSQTIGFLNARSVKPFEISTVSYPAFASATTPEDQIADL